ncbi:MAG: glycosyltransferase family 9 protein [Chloroflexota bacterium]|nr:glycosyltransferase family 9 protein [Chloroflexota bacterium]
MRANTILVIPFADGIGDFINVQPLLAAVKRGFPDAELTVAASEHGNALINDPTIQVVKPSGFNYEPGRMAIALRPLLPQKLLAWMAGPMFDRELGPFDLVINFFFAWERGMDFRLFWTPQVPPMPGAVHSLDYLANELERQLDVRITSQQRTPRLVVRPAAHVWASRFLTGNDLDEKRLVALVPSSNMAIKRWTLDGWLQLDRDLAARGVQTLLFCERPNSTLERAFRAAGSSALPVYTSLDNVAGLLTRCDLVVGVDTGLLHMASALNVHWVGLFGPTNPDVTGPYSRSEGVSLVAPFEKEASCAGCWKHFKYEDDTCRTLPEGSCMRYLAETDVLGACLSMLDKAGNPLPVLPLGYIRRPVDLVAAS